MARNIAWAYRTRTSNSGAVNSAAVRPPLPLLPWTHRVIPAALRNLLLLLGVLGAGSINGALTACSDIAAPVAAVEPVEIETSEEAVTTVSAVGLHVFLRDEAQTEANMSKPRLYLVNSGTQALSNFTLQYYFTVDTGKTPVLEDYYTPTSTAVLQQVSGTLWRVSYTFTGITLNPGQTTDSNTSPSGNVVGLHYGNWANWNKADDWSHNGITSAFTETTNVTVLDSQGFLVAGTPPPGVTLPLPPPPPSTAPHRLWFTVTTPSGVPLRDVALGAGVPGVGGELKLGENAQVLPLSPTGKAVVANLGTGATDIGKSTKSSGVYGAGSVIIRGAQVTGDVVASGSLTVQAGSQVTGTTYPAGTQIPKRTQTWSVVASGVRQTVPAGTTKVLTPGRWGAVQLTNGQTLKFATPGVYFVDSLQTEYGSTLWFDNAAGPIYVHVENAPFTYRSLPTKTSTSDNIEFTYSGTSVATIEKSFPGALVAPYAKLDIGTVPGFQQTGTFFGRDIELRANTPLVSRPLTLDCAAEATACRPSLACPLTDTDGDLVPDCEETRDATTWTNPKVPNGINLHRSAQCTPTSGNGCSLIDTRAELNACAAGSAVEAHPFSAGWNWPTQTASNLCETGYGFAPNWNQCPAGGSVFADGYFLAETTGTHCFRLVGDTTSSCGALYIGTATTGILSGAATKCLSLTRGVTPINWGRVGTPTTKGAFSIRYCNGGSAACDPVDELPFESLRLQDCGGDEVCSAECKCTQGNECASHSDCGAGLVCARNLGQRFQKDPSASICVAPFCIAQPAAPECRAEFQQCNTDADCDGGRCSAQAAAAFPSAGVSPGTKLCWSNLCETGAGLCGDEAAPCGACQCTGSCAGKQCGDNPFNGCDALCGPLCAAGEVGCHFDAECPLNHRCVSGAGAFYGHTPNGSACMPSDCLDGPFPNTECGTTASKCGTYCAEPESCVDRECGPDPKTQVECGVCPSGSVCAFGGKCDTPLAEAPLQSFTLRSKATAVGALAGDYDVTPTGTSTYRIPLKLPRGSRGLTPNLAFAFRDVGSKRGVMGPGWSLEGIPRIHRCAPIEQDDLSRQARVHDAIPRGFCIDGTPLTLDATLTALEPSGGRVYRPADSTGVKVVQYPSEYDPTNEDWSTFKLYLPDGTVQTFGESNVFHVHSPGTDVFDQSVTDQWLLDEIQDRFGNRIGFDHDNYYGTGVRSYTRPTALWWVGGAVRFNYKVKDDSLGQLGGFYRGLRRDDAALLDEVVVTAREGTEWQERARVYKLHYEVASGSGLQRIESITECVPGDTADGAEVCFDPTTFKYDDGEVVTLPSGKQQTARFGTRTTGAIAGNLVLNYKTGFTENRHRTLVFDADGDGYQDLLQIDSVDGYRFYPASVHDGKLSYPKQIDITEEFRPIMWPCLSSGAVGDVDGDGRDELLHTCHRGVADEFVEYFNVDKDGHVSLTTTDIPSRASAYFADLDGDGALEIVQETEDYIYDSQRLYTGEFTMARVDAQGQPSPVHDGRESAAFLLDVDGDGTPNLLRYDSAKQQYLALTLAPTLEPGGPLDLLVEDGGLYLWAMRGRWAETGLAMPPPIVQDGRSTRDDTKIIDINGDGLPDVWSSQVTVLATMTKEDANPFRGTPIEFLGGGYGTGIASKYNSTAFSGFFPVEYEEPSLVWINEGGRFSLHRLAFSEHSFLDLSTCKVKFDDGKCAVQLHPESFRLSTVMDVDNDGRQELVYPYRHGDELTWTAFHLAAEDWGIVELAAEPLAGIPSEWAVYNRVLPANLVATLAHPLWADLDTDGNVDFLLAGPTGTASSRILIMGQGGQAGSRLKRVTDGLGNQIEVSTTKGPKGAAFTGNCNGDRQDPLGDLEPARCLASSRSVVEKVVRKAAGEQVLTQTKYSYENPRSAAFMRGLQFERRQVDQFAMVDGNLKQVATISEKFGNLEPGALNVTRRTGTYPFGARATDREIAYTAQPDVDGSLRGRIVTELFQFQVGSSGAPQLKEGWRTVSDEFNEGYGISVYDHVDSLYDSKDRLSLRETETYVGNSFPGVPLVATTEQFTYAEHPELWLLTDHASESMHRRRNGTASQVDVDYEYDPTTGYLHRRIDHASSNTRELITEFAYDTHGNVRQITQTAPDGEERVASTEFDSLGVYPVQTTNAEGHTRTFNYDPLNGGLRALEDETGFVSVLNYDGFGRLSGSSTRSGTTTISYQTATPYEVGNSTIQRRYVRETTSDHMAKIREEFDSRGLVVRSVVPGLASGTGTPWLYSESFYDWSGRLLRRSAPHEEDAPVDWTSNAYDLWGRQVSQTTAQGTKRLGYASRPNLEFQHPGWLFPDSVSATVLFDEVGHQTATIVDHQQAIVAVADGVIAEYSEGQFDGFVSRIELGGHGKPIAFIDPEGNEATLEYAADGALETQQDVNRGLTTFEYTAFGQVREQVAADGAVSTLKYDRLGRVRARHDDDGVTTWTYDTGSSAAAGKLSETTSPSGVHVNYQYEDSPRALLESVTYELNGETFVTSLDYDDFARIQRQAYPGEDDFATRPEYDPHSGQLRALLSDDRSTAFWRVTDADNQGRITETTLGNGLAEVFAYDPQTRNLGQRLVKDGLSTLSELQYAYYANGQVYERELNHEGNHLARTYYYDRANRIDLVSYSNDNERETFRFTPNGRIESTDKDGDYSYDPLHPHAMKRVGDSTFEYDARGNQILRSGSAIPGGRLATSYTAFDLPATVTLANGSNSSQSFELTYDAGQQRVAKRSMDGAEVLTVGDYERVTKADSATGLRVEHRYHIRAGGREFAQVTLNEEDSTRMTVYHHVDRLGTVLFTSDEAGNLSSLRDFDTYGAPRGGPVWDNGISTGFAGQDVDEEFGLLVMGARLYDPQFGMFTTADPLLWSGYSSQGLNAYAYVNNDPVNLIDPRGLCSQNVESSDGELGVTIEGPCPVDFSDDPLIVTGRPPEAPPPPPPPPPPESWGRADSFFTPNGSDSLFKAEYREPSAGPDDRVACYPACSLNPREDFPTQASWEAYKIGTEIAANVLMAADLGINLARYFGIGVAARGAGQLAAGTGKQMLGEALNVLKAAPSADRMGLMRQLIPQIQSRATGGAWSATEMAASGGARAWVGETHTLVIDAAGKVFSGAHVGGAAQFGLVEGELGVTSWAGLKALF